MKAFENALKSFNAKADLQVAAVGKPEGSYVNVAGKTTLPMFVRETIHEPGIALSAKDSCNTQPTGQSSTTFRELLNPVRPSNIDQLYRRPSSFANMPPAGFELRDGVLMTEDSGCNCKERSEKLGLPGLQCILCGSSEARQTMFSDTEHVKGIFCQDEIAKRILTGMELDLGKDDVTTEDPSLQSLADSLRTGWYSPTFDGAKGQPCYDNRRTLLALKTIAEAVGCKDHFSFSLQYEKGFRLPDEEVFVDVTVPGGVGMSKHVIEITKMAENIRRLGRSDVHDEAVGPGLAAFATVLAHTLNEQGTGFKYSLVQELSNKSREEKDSAMLEKFKVSFQNILTLLGYGEEVRFEVVAKPALQLGGYRVKVEFICEEPPVKMYETINPAIFEHEWIDCGEISRIEQKLINKKEEENLENQKRLPLSTRLVDAFDAVGDEMLEGFLKPGTVITGSVVELSSRALVEARWKHIHDIDAKALKILFDGGFAESAIAGMLKVEIHESQLAFKHHPVDCKLVEVPLTYEAAYMMFAEQFLEEILNQPHFPYPAKAFIRHFHPVNHNLGVVDAVLPVLNRIINKTKKIQVVSRDLFNHPILK